MKRFWIAGIVVEDCLLLLQNLLRSNTSNQNFFKEGSYIQKLKPFFHLEDDPHTKHPGWSAQKVTNMHLLLQVNECGVCSSGNSNNSGSSIYGVVCGRKTVVVIFFCIVRPFHCMSGCLSPSTTTFLRLSGSECAFQVIGFTIIA